MPAPSGSVAAGGGPTSRLRELGIVLPVPPAPLSEPLSRGVLDVVRWKQRAALQAVAS